MIMSFAGFCFDKIERMDAKLPFNGKYLKAIFLIFPALKNRNYRLYFGGQLISLVGTWLQMVAQGWLVLELTNSAFLLGVVAAMGSLPTLLFSLLGGAAVDRLPKRKILLFTQSASMVLAFSLGMLTVLHLVTVFQIIVLAFLLGLVSALDAPARQAYVVEMVGRENLHSAIALNAGIFNGARVIGPSIAGLLIATVGTGNTFLINGVSYIAVIAALLAMRIKDKVHPSDLHPLEAIKEGISYTFTHPTIRVLILFAAVISIFGWSYTTILPFIAQNTFHAGASGFGHLLAAAGLGALVAVVLVSALSNKINPLIFILGGNLVFGLSMLLFTYTANLIIALIYLFFAGFGLICQFSTMSATIQHLVKDRFMGRVMSIYTIVFFGFAPFGSLQIGFLADHFGPEFAIRVGVIILLLVGIPVYLYRKRFQKTH